MFHTPRIGVITIPFVLWACVACVPASAQTPLFHQCPAIGLSTGCSYLIAVSDSGTRVLMDPTQLPIDGSGDATVVGVQNASSSPIASLSLNGGSVPILAFSMTGICSVVPAPAGCPFGPTGYEGPGTSFTNISTDQTAGTVVFSPAIPPGGHAYFSVAGFVTASSGPLTISCNPNTGPTQQGAFYSTTCTATGGPLTSQVNVPLTPAYKWSLTGNVPPGLALNSTTGNSVTVSGIPTAPGSYGYAVQVTDNSIPSPQSSLEPFSGVITQLGGLCHYTLSAGSAAAGTAASSGFVLVSSPPGCPQWFASSPVSWVTITSGASGTGNGRVDFSVQANSGAPRSATLSIAGQSFLVNQLTGCVFGISPSQAQVPVGGGGGTITVGALNPGCIWSAVPDSNSFWLTVNGSLPGVGNGSVSFTAAPNPSETGRTGTIEVAGQIFTVTQAGSNCTYALPQSTQAVPASGGTGSVSVLAPAGCSWTIVNNLPWVAFSTTGGSGNGTVNFIAQSNPSTTASRTGTLSIAGVPYAITQPGTSPLVCVASVATPPEVALEGRTEVLGDLVLSCQGILSALTADISVTLNTNVTNALSGGNTTDAVLTVNGGAPLNGLVAGYNVIHWPGVSLVPGPGGVTTVLIGKVRGDASLLGAPANLQASSVTGLVSLNSVLPIPVTNPLQAMASVEPAVDLVRLPPPPTAFPTGIIPVRIQEGSPAAFHAATGTAPATRLRLVLTNIPAGLQIMAPVFPNEGATAQLYTADFNGAGGIAVTGGSSIPLTVTNGTASATWVVLAADPTQIDTYSFYLFLPNVVGFDLSQMQVTATLGPVSDVSVASATAPVPRYRDFSVIPQLVNLRTTSATLLAAALPVNIETFINQAINDNPNQAASNVVLRDRVPVGASIQTCQATGGGNCAVTGNEAVVTYTALQPGQSAAVTLTVRVDPSLPLGTVVESLFSATSDQPNADPTGANSSSLFIGGGSSGGNQPASLTATTAPQAASLGTQFPNPLQATLRDTAGNPVPGALITFVAPSNGPSAALSSNTAVTNAQGVASVTAIANTIPGTYPVTATYSVTSTQTTLSATFTLVNFAGQPGTDIAQGKAATQSSAYPGAPPAAVAVDGNTDGNFFDGSVTATNLDTNAWWQVDLGVSTPIQNIVIWNRTDCCATRLSDYWVFVSDTPFNANDTPATLQNRAGTFASHQTSTPNPSVTIPAFTRGRYVRVQLSGADYLSLAEVQVFASGSLAQGKPATQSSTLSGVASAAAGSAVDGNTDGNFYDGSVTATNADTNAWWQVDLGASSPIGSIVLWNRTDCCASRLTDFWVFVSDTPFLNTDTPATLQNRPGTFASHQTSAPNPSTVIAGAIQGRYVRIQLSGTDYLSLAEVQVFAPGSSTVRVATQSSTLPGVPSAGAASAIDGNTDGNFYDGSVTATNADPNAWWQVDLGASTAINSLVIWNRTDCCGSRLSDYWVFVSDTPFLPTDTPATLQVRAGTFASHQTSAPNPTTAIAVGARGRYVRVQLSGTDYLSLAEVQIQ